MFSLDFYILCDMIEEIIQVRTGLIQPCKNNAYNHGQNNDSCYDSGKDPFGFTTFEHANTSFQKGYIYAISIYNHICITMSCFNAPPSICQEKRTGRQ